MRFGALRLSLVCSAFMFILSASPVDLPAQTTVSLGDLARHAIEVARLTASGGKPFHLKATIVETTNPDSDLQGDVEEYWVSPQRWRRVIHSPQFSQTLVVNGDKVSETDTGDYYPFWLRELVTAIFDPLPMFSEMKNGEIKRLKTQIPNPAQQGSKNSCARFESKVGTPPAENTLLEMFCFEGDYSLPRTAITPGYAAEFEHYKPFGKKWIARTITINPEPDTTVEARVVELTELSKPDESLFVAEPPGAPDQQLKSVRVEEAELRKMGIRTSDIVWPPVQEGKTSGVLTLYISTDRNGKVREAWPIGSENPALNEAASEQVKQWELKPAVSEGIHVQVEGTLTLAFKTGIAQSSEPQPAPSPQKTPEQ